MTKEIKPSVEQEDAIQKKTKSVSDKKTAKKLEAVSPILKQYDTIPSQCHEYRQTEFDCLW